MSIKLNDFVSHLKREGQFGSIAVINDQPTADILSSINKRLAAIWGRADWKWSRELLRFAMSPNVRQYAVTAASSNPIDRIQDLIPYDPTNTYLQGKPLNQRTDRDFYTRVAQPLWNGNSVPASSVFNIGAPTDYYIVQQDVNGIWQIIVDPVPNLASFMGGYAKAILSTYVNADVVANNPILYFPNGVVLDALFTGCMIDIALLRGLPIEQALQLEPNFEAKIKRLVADQIGVSTDNTPITTRLPSTVSRLRRHRFGRW